MRPSRCTIRLAWLVLATLAWCRSTRADEAQPEAGLPQPIATRQKSFAIPFRFPQAPPGTAQPVEVELSVSHDQGQTWQVYSTARPPQNSFTFRAVEDGEFWFAVRTRDRTGKLRPEGEAKAELRVIVDSAPPKLNLTVVRNSAGDLEAQLEVSDPHLKADTLLLEYQAAGAGERWHAVAIDPIPSDGPAHRGEVTWRPEKESTFFLVRAKIADTAGNPVTAQAQVPALPPAGMKASAAGKAPLATVPPANPAQPTNPDPFYRSPAGQRDPGAALPSAESPNRISPLPAVTGQTAQGAGASQWPPDETTDDPLAGPTVPGGPPRGPFRPAGSQQYADPDHPAAYAGLPPGVRPRMINSTEFQLEYDVDAVGPWGIRKVELWGTRDGGATWSALGDDADNQSPLAAHVEGEGLYGFRILVQSGSGMVELPPRSGDLPEIWIGIDLTRPSGRITHVEQGAGERAGQVIVDWEAEDNLPTERPISLAFSDRPEGPWSNIAAGLRNSGRFVWQLDHRVPDQVYLRLEVRDEAGNLAICDYPAPVPVDRLRPKGRILDVPPRDWPVASC